jgi:hypothetical protein
MSLKDDAEAVSALRAGATTEPRSFALRSAPGGTEENVRARRPGELDLGRLLPLGEGHP